MVATSSRRREHSCSAAVCRLSGWRNASLSDDEEGVGVEHGGVATGGVVAGEGAVVVDVVDDDEDGEDDARIVVAAGVVLSDTCDGA
jgi:hypothetical protein